MSDTKRKPKPTKRGDLRLPTTPERLVKVVVRGGVEEWREPKEDW